MRSDALVALLVVAAGGGYWIWRRVSATAAPGGGAAPRREDPLARTLTMCLASAHAVGLAAEYDRLNSPVAGQGEHARVAARTAYVQENLAGRVDASLSRWSGGDVNLTFTGTFGETRLRCVPGNPDPQPFESAGFRGAGRVGLGWDSLRGALRAG